MPEVNEQQAMIDVALKTKDRIAHEIPHLQNLIGICKEDHESYIAPLSGVMRSFAIFCNSEDNIKFLDYVSELYASYAFAKQHKDSLERRQSKTIIQTLKARRDEIDTTKRKGMEVDFHFDFFPLIRQYYLLLIRGHRQSTTEETICKDMLTLVGEIAERELQNHYTALETCEKLLH